jgi:hypothetical protein
MKKFIINVDENDPEFRKYVAKRVELARDPKNQISIEEAFKLIDKKFKKARKDERVYS